MQRSYIDDIQKTRCGDQHGSRCAPQTKNSAQTHGEDCAEWHCLALIYRRLHSMALFGNELHHMTKEAHRYQTGF